MNNVAYFYKKKHVTILIQDQDGKFGRSGKSSRNPSILAVYKDSPFTSRAEKESLTTAACWLRSGLGFRKRLEASARCHRAQRHLILQSPPSKEATHASADSDQVPCLQRRCSCVTSAVRRAASGPPLRVLLGPGYGCAFVAFRIQFKVFVISTFYRNY
jgi:hypothetical protein